MTTDITIRTNGNYIAKGTLTITPAEGEARKVEINVGPGIPEAVSQTEHIPHGSTASLELEEKHADEWAQAEVEGTDAAQTEGGDVG